MFLLVILLCIGLVHSQLPLSNSEYTALWDLYNATDGADWVWPTSADAGIPWEFTADADPCTDNWQGVICNTVGSVPATSVYHVSQLQLSDMLLDGYLPESLRALVQLQHLDVSMNNLKGPIPDIGGLTELNYIDLDSNHFTGAFPTFFANLTLLQTLDLQSNYLTGSIPLYIGNLTQLRFLDLSYNLLTGSIPDCVGNLKEMEYLYFYSSNLTGSIPDSIGSLAQLLRLDFASNRLTGSIPDTIGLLPNLTYILLSYNAISGPIPSSIGNLAQLTFLEVDSNRLTSTIPASIGNLVNLVVLDVRVNRLTGSIPASLAHLTNLIVLVLNSNQLTGSIPSVLALSLGYYNVADNLLTGPLPSGFSQMNNLSELIVNNNELTGPISDLFSPLQTKMVNVQLESNQFTGTIPSVLFPLPSLASVSIIGSCLHGTLPDNICQATQLEALILYGLTTGTSCRSKGVQSLSLTHKTFGGTFPSCLLALPRLATLLLASNGLTGSIDSEGLVGPKLLELDLSHNRLSGSIPNSVQNHTWLLLDLSHNKLNGVLHTDLLGHNNQSHLLEIALEEFSTIPAYFTGATVTLLSNRLSGPVPSSVMRLRDLSMLAGNLFECRYDKSNLPKHDSDEGTYQCASNSFDIAIYVWLGLFVCLFVAPASVVLHQGGIQEAVATLATLQLPTELTAELGYVYALLETHHTLLVSAWYCAAFCMAVLLPYYGTVSVYQGTHTHQYAYAVSAIYVSGVVPFVFTTLLLATLLCGLYYAAVWSKNSNTNAAAEDVHSGSWLQRAYVMIIFTITNVTLVLGANVAFVYVVLYQTSELQTLSQVLLSLFKLVWSALVSPFMIRSLALYFLPAAEISEAPAESFFTLQLFVSLFNNIAIPCLVVAAIDPNCFSNILLPPDTETVSFRRPQCVDEGKSCFEVYQLSSLQFTPPFTYSYQCSASFITYYAPTFIYMSISTTFLSPLLQYLLVRLHQRLGKDTTAHRMLSGVLSHILKTPAPDVPTAQFFRRSPLLGAVGVLVTLLTQLGILLTFGAIFPPVALAMAVSISTVVFVTKFKIQRFLRAAVDLPQLGYLSIINAECAALNTRGRVQLAVIIIIGYCCAFYAMFLFDMLGDKVGFSASAWVVIVVPLSPWTIFSVKNAANGGKRDAASPGLSGVELPTVESKELATANVLHANGV